MNLLEHEMKMVEMVLVKRLHRIVTFNEKEIGSITEKGKIDAVFILRRMQDGHNAKRTKCFADQEKALDKVPRKVPE